MKTMPVEIMTPDRTVSAADVEFVVVPGYSGELGILPGHMPLMSMLVPGSVRYTAGGSVTTLYIAAGFAKISRDKIQIFTTNVRSSR